MRRSGLLRATLWALAIAIAVGYVAILVASRY
jgi:hypothetical protein